MKRSSGENIREGRGRNPADRILRTRKEKGAVRRGSLIFAGMAVLGSLCGCTVAGYDISIDHAYFPNSSAFSINHETCGGTEARLYLCNYKNLYGNVYGLKLWGYEFEGVTLEEYVKAVTIDELSRVYCMEQIAGEQGIALDEAEKKRVSKAAAVYYQSLTSEEIDYLGIGSEQLEEYYTRYALAEKLYLTMTEGETEEVSDDDARVIRIRQILVREKSTAKQVKEQLDAGAEFAALASTYSESQEFELTVARGQLPKELEDAAFELDDGEISGRIQTEDGYYFIQCISKYEEKLTEANKEVLLTRRREQRFEETYSEFVEKAEHTLNEAFWNNVDFEDMEITTDSFFSTYEDLTG